MCALDRLSKYFQNNVHRTCLCLKEKQLYYGTCLFSKLLCTFVRLPYNILFCAKNMNICKFNLGLTLIYICYLSLPDSALIDVAGH